MNKSKGRFVLNMPGKFEEKVERDTERIGISLVGITPEMRKLREVKYGKKGQEIGE